MSKTDCCVIYTPQKPKVEWDDVEKKPEQFPPEPHADTHAKDGSDPLAPADIGAAEKIWYPTHEGVLTINNLNITGLGYVREHTSPPPDTQTHTGNDFYLININCINDRYTAQISIRRPNPTVSVRVREERIWGPWVRLLAEGDLAPVWQNMTLKNGWNAVFTPQYRKIGNTVYLRGTVRWGSGAITTLPVGYRPQVESNHAVICRIETEDVASGVYISPDGTVNTTAPSSSLTVFFLPLDGIIFHTD